MNAVINQARTLAMRARRKAKRDRVERGFIEASARVPGANAFAGLNPMSLAVASVRPSDQVRPRVSLIVPEIRAEAIFAGIRTALEVSVGVANSLELPLRIFALWDEPNPRASASIREFLRDEFGLSRWAEVEVLHVSALTGLAVSADELWIGTHWTTVHPLDVAARLNVIRPDRVIYLAQDYEPGFYPWSTEFAIARATYHAGFRLVVNSEPLAAYLRDAEHLDVDPALVFAPSLDLGRLEESAANRRKSAQPSVMFYGRPNKPRNLFAIGISALKLSATSPANNGVSYSSVGESHATVALSGTTTLASRGKLSWQGYFELLSNTDVMFSLQHSPHPSHPPLDSVVSGGITVTNELAGTRAALHPRLLTAEPDPTLLGQRLNDAIEMARSSEPAGFDSTFITKLGAPLTDVVKHASALVA